MSDITKDVKYAIDLFPWFGHEDIDEGEVRIGGLQPVKPIYTFIHQHDENEENIPEMVKKWGY